MNSNWSYSPETPNLGQIWPFLEPCDLEIWQMTLKNKRAPLLCCFKLCITFPSHWWIQIGVTVRKRPIWVKFRRFLEPCDLEIWRMTLKYNRAPLPCCFKLCITFPTHWWPWKTLGHLFYAISSFMHHFVPIGEFKLELQSGNDQFGSNSTIFRAVHPWILTNDLEKQQGTSSMPLQALCIIS